MKQGDYAPCIDIGCNFAKTPEMFLECAAKFDPAASATGVLRRNCPLLREAANNYVRQRESDIAITSEIAKCEGLN
jgi:hypothetical protein